MVEPIARVAKASSARLRPLMHFLRRGWSLLANPGVRLIGGKQKIASAVRLRASDGGRVELGPGCELSRGVEIVAQKGKVEIGARSYIGPWTMITAKANVTIGVDCLVAERVSIRDQDHELHGPPGLPIAQAGFRVAPIAIGDGVWIGAGAVILKGVTIGEGAVVAANAVVNREVHAREIVGGIPARRIGMRKNGDA